MGILAKVRDILQAIPVWIYNLFISRVLTVVSHTFLMEYLKTQE